MKKNKVSLYVSEIPEKIELSELGHTERDAEINSVSNSCVKAEKYYVWKLLLHAAFQKFGITQEKAGFYRSESGRWHASGFDFSLSHSHGIACVALSPYGVGVDVERVSDKIERLADKLLDDAELREYATLDGEKKLFYMTRRWTEAEALFKLRDISRFMPRKMKKTSGEYLKSGDFSALESEYVFSIAASTDFEFDVYFVNSREVLKNAVSDM